MPDDDHVAVWLAVRVTEADCVTEGVPDTLDVAAWLPLGEIDSVCVDVGVAVLLGVGLEERL